MPAISADTGLESALESGLDPIPLFDPRTFLDGVPHDLIADLRAHAPVHWVAEPELMGWEAGPGFWAVLTHELMNRVLRDPGTFSSHLGGTQIRDPQTAAMLEFVQRMMLNQDPPQHTRLRRLLMRSFTPSAVAELEATISDRARMLVDNVADRGRADFAKDVSAELPLLTLADIMGVPTEDRMLLFDWSNRVIGYQGRRVRGLRRVRPGDRHGDGAAFPGGARRDPPGVRRPHARPSLPRRPRRHVRLRP